jgi:hypothetical protein
MILGTQLFLTGFLGELIIRHSNDRNHYEIGEETSNAPALEAPRHDNDLPDAVKVESKATTLDAQ